MPAWTPRWKKPTPWAGTLKNITIDHSQTNAFIFYMEYCTIVKAYVVENGEERRLREERETSERDAANAARPETPARGEKTPQPLTIPPTPAPTQNAVHKP